MVKNNTIINQTWGALVTHMYIPIEVSFSLPTKDADELDYETGYDLAMEKVYKILDGIDTNPEYMYSFELEMESDHNVDS